LHIGVDSKTKLIHAMKTTAANVHDATVLGELLHGDETRVYGDQAYRGQRAVIREHAPNAKDFTNRRYRHRGVIDEVERGKNRTKSGYALHHTNTARWPARCVLRTVGRLSVMFVFRP
jgi:IS5 family transposase